MSRATQILDIATTQPHWGFFGPLATEADLARWRINGYRATILIWTVRSGID